MEWYLKLLADGDYNLINGDVVIAKIIEQPTIEETDQIAYLIKSAPILLDAFYKIKSELLRSDLLDERIEHFIDHILSQTKKP